MREAASQEPAVPRPLACYQRLYGLASEQHESRWYLLLPSGQRVLYDDGQAKDAQTLLDRPDVEDQFATRYLAGRTGPLHRESQVDRDPGRVRVTAILAALFPVRVAGATQLVRVDWFGARLQVHRRMAPALERVRARIDAALAREPSLRPWLDRPGGGYAYRPIAGTDRLSAHSFGIAIDLDPKRTEYWRWDRDLQKNAQLPFARPVPASLVEAFEAEGFIWGGRWYHYDTMHFEYRPELIDPQCQPLSAP
jgi:hypothetical protein